MLETARRSSAGNEAVALIVLLLKKWKALTFLATTKRGHQQKQAGDSCTWAPKAAHGVPMSTQVQYRMLNRLSAPVSRPRLVPGSSRPFQGKRFFWRRQSNTTPFPSRSCRLKRSTIWLNSSNVIFISERSSGVTPSRTGLI